jgi:hypothetical protein
MSFDMSRRRGAPKDEPPSQEWLRGTIVTRFDIVWGYYQGLPRSYRLIRMTGKTTCFREPQLVLDRDTIRFLPGWHHALIGTWEDLMDDYWDKCHKHQAAIQHMGYRERAAYEKEHPHPLHPNPWEVLRAYLKMREKQGEKL